MLQTIKLSAADIKIIKEECKREAMRHSRSKRFQVLVGCRFNTDGAYPDKESINIWAISNDPDDEWGDTDLYDTIEFDIIKKPIELTANGRAILDFYIYEWDGVFRCWGDLVCNAQAELDINGLKAIHADIDKNRWVRP